MTSGLGAWSAGRHPAADTAVGGIPALDGLERVATLYWLTGTATSSARIHWEEGQGADRPDDGEHRGFPTSPAIVRTARWNLPREYDDDAPDGCSPSDAVVT